MILLLKKENDYLTNNYWKIESDSYDQNSFTIFNYSPNAVAEMTILMVGVQNIFLVRQIWMKH